jgi:putative ABC transport system permease protein
MLQDVRLAFRSLRQQPGFAALAILIVALGAGANASIFSVVRAVLLEPLPYARPDRLVAVWPDGFISNADLAFMRARIHSLSAVAGVSPGWTMSLVGAGDPMRITATKTSANLFDVIGARPLLGRTFADGEDLPGRHRVAILSFTLWQSRFAGDPAVIGRLITLEGAPHQVIGVMPADFELLGRDAELWVPLPFDVASPFHRGTTAQGIGRLREGMDLTAAERELRSLVPAWQQQLGYEKDWGQGRTIASLRDMVVGDVRRPLIVLIGAVGLIVLLTAANLGTLLLGRHVARRRDIAVRGALGASAWRLFRHSATESVVLATLGAVAGILVARAMLPALVSLLPPEMPRLAAIDIDAVVLAVVLLSSALSVLVFGVAPSIGAFRRLPAEAGTQLRAASHGDSSSARRTLHALVVGQVALAIVLGIGAALMVRSLLALQSVDPGFDARPVLTLKLQPSGERYRGLSRTLPYYRRVMQEIRAVPGVQAVGTINHLPLSGYNWMSTVRLDERPLPPGVSPPTAGWRMIDGDYFASMRIPLRAGRLFTEHDTNEAPEVAIVNEAFARHFFGGTSAAVGRVIRTGSASGEQAPTIVGVVGDVRHRALAEAARPELYRPVAQSFAIALAVTVRTSGAPARLVGAVRDAVRRVDRDVAIADLLPLTTLLRESLGHPRLMATLLLVFAGVGLAIVVSGVYGVVAYSVRRREREMGIRLALGAAPLSVSGLVIRQGLGYAFGGLIVGLPVALGVTGVMQSLLFGIEPRDPATIAALCLTVTAATIAATLVPARRALRVDPAAVLKAE